MKPSNDRKKGKVKISMMEQIFWIVLQCNNRSLHSVEINTDISNEKCTRISDHSFQNQKNVQKKSYPTVATDEAIPTIIIWAFITVELFSTTSKLSDFKIQNYV